MEYCEVSSTYMVKFHKVDKKVKRHWFYMCVCVSYSMTKYFKVKLTKIHHIFIYISIFSHEAKKYQNYPWLILKIAKSALENHQTSIKPSKSLPKL